MVFIVGVYLDIVMIAIDAQMVLFVLVRGVVSMLRVSCWFGSVLKFCLIWVFLTSLICWFGIGCMWLGLRSDFILMVLLLVGV